MRTTSHRDPIAVTRACATLALRIGLLAFVACSGACAPILAHRFTPFDAGQTDCSPQDDGAVDAGCATYLHERAQANGTAPDSPCYDLMFAEFDDQGWLNTRGVTDQHGYRTLSPDALRTHDAFDGIREFLQQQDQRKLLIVTFVHGWKHSAASADGNVREFRRKLAKFCLLNQRNHLDQHIVGIYLGWRGDSLRGPDIERSALTFYDRRSTAKRVSKGAIHDVIAYINAYEHKRNTGTGCSQSGDKPRDCAVSSVFIGHSFGGAILYEALEPMVLESVQAADIEANVAQAEGTGAAPSLQRYGDIIVLINPAIEASRFQPVLRMMARRPPSAYHAPLMTLITTTADHATGNWFPIGRTFGTLLERTINDEERDANTHTIGQFPPYLTHTLTHDDAQCQHQRSGSPDNASRCFGSGNVLVSNDAAYNRFPIWNVTTDSTVMVDHSDLQSENLEGFIEALWDEVRSFPLR